MNLRLVAASANWTQKVRQQISEATLTAEDRDHLTVTIACQADGTTVLSRPRDHSGRLVMVILAPVLVNYDALAAACRGRCWRRWELAFDDEFVAGWAVSRTLDGFSGC